MLIILPAIFLFDYVQSWSTFDSRIFYADSKINWKINLSLSKRKSGNLKVAAGLAAAAGLTASQAHAGVVYVPFTATVDASTTPVNIDVDHDGQSELSINLAGSSLSLDWTGPKQNYISVGTSGTTLVDALPFGETIGSTPPSGDSYTKLGGLTDPGDLSNFTPGSGLQYIGMNFDLTSTGTGDHFGWIGFETTGDPSLGTLQGQIEGFAYQSVAGDSISAGQVPEPTSLALLAAGCGGLALYRPRRRPAIS